MALPSITCRRVVELSLGQARSIADAAIVGLEAVLGQVLGSKIKIGEWDGNRRTLDAGKVLSASVTLEADPDDACTIIEIYVSGVSVMISKSRIRSIIDGKLDELLG